MALKLVLDKKPDGEWEYLKIQNPDGSEAKIVVESTTPYKLRLKVEAPREIKVFTETNEKR